MGLFNFKRKAAEETEMEMNQQSEDSVTPIDRSKFIMEERVTKSQLPIYEVYARLQEDWETKGFNDAKAFPETLYRENRKRVIIENLLLHIKEVSTKYEDKMTEIEGCIEQASKSGFVEALERYKQSLKILSRHSQEMELLVKDINEIGEKTSAILLSYDMGFARGIAAVGDDKVYNIMNS